MKTREDLKTAYHAGRNKATLINAEEGAYISKLPGEPGIGHYPGGSKRVRRAAVVVIVKLQKDPYILFCNICQIISSWQV